jgi:hypothetical protein
MSATGSTCRASVGGGADRRRRRFAQQAAEHVEDVLLVGRATLQRQFHGGEHGLLVVAQDQGQDLDHLLVAAGALQQLLLQRAEAVGQFQEGRAVAQRAGLALATLR